MIIPPASALRPAAWLVAGYAVLKTILDPDLWGHVQFGRDMLREWDLPRVDPYSFTQDRPWINHEWLSELHMGAAYAVGGPLGLMLLKSLMAAAGIAVVWRSFRHAGLVWRWGTAVLVTLSLVPIVTTLRPQLWTVLLLALLCQCLTDGGRRLWFIPAIFLLWANLHGGWVLGLGVLAAWVSGQVLDRHVERRLFVVAGLSVLATLVTPYGWELWSFIASTVRLSRADITEWQPIWSNNAAVVFWLAGLAFVALSWRTHGRPTFSTLLPLAMLSVASFRVLRLVPLFVLAAVMLLARRFPRVELAPTPRALTIIEVVVCGAGLALAVQTRAIPSCISMEDTHAPDPVVFASLIEARPAGRMITSFNWGEAVLAKLGPAVKVSIDGRRETVYSAAALTRQYAMADGTPAGLEALARLSPDYVWLPLPSSRRTHAWLTQNGYRIDVETGESFVAVRSDLPRIMRAPTHPAMCFPFGSGT